ncbi:hypothetical protein B0H13DRAFT_2661597 [Mycena leptocephala]|nr:hypothetical protein B0H13DRAFT_2661597 [Mycena leptocephala]
MRAPGREVSCIQNPPMHSCAPEIPRDPDRQHRGTGLRRNHRVDDPGPRVEEQRGLPGLRDGGAVQPSSNASSEKTKTTLPVQGAHLLARLKLRSNVDGDVEAVDEPEVDFPSPPLSCSCSCSPSRATNYDTSDANDPEPAGLRACSSSLCSFSKEGGDDEGVANNKDAGKTAESGEGDPWPVVTREITENGENVRLAASRPAPSFLRVRTVTIGVKTENAALRPNVPANPANEALAAAFATRSIVSPNVLTIGLPRPLLPPAADVSIAAAKPDTIGLASGLATDSHQTPHRARNRARNRAPHRTPNRARQQGNSG